MEFIKNSKIFCPFPSTVKAFTLAEVLITLAIIGVVAALTIPLVITKYKETQYKTAYRKAYSTLSSAINSTKFELGGNVQCYYGARNDCMNLWNETIKHLNVVGTTDLKAAVIRNI